jgi:trimeric autotransporter adhesin
MVRVIWERRQLTSVEEQGMGSEGTTSSSGGAASSPANVVLTMTPMQAKALATLIGRSARRGSGLDALRIALIRGASEVNSREPSSAASALAETKAFVAGVQVEIAAAREASSVAKSSAAAKRSVVAAALMTAEAASHARDVRAGAAACAALNMADTAAQTASDIQTRADALAIRVATAASKAADIVSASIASGTEEEGALIALQLAATVDAAAIATAEETALAAAAVATAVAAAATQAALAAAAAAAAFEREVTNAAAAVKRVATTTARDLALNTDAKAVEVAQAARGPIRF